MLKVLYEDDEILVVIKPAGVESQAAKRFAPDMVSEVKKHLVINKSCTPGKEPYVGVIHRLDKPVSGVMVYAKTKNAAAALSKQVAEGKMHKKYLAVLCGKPVDNVENLVENWNECVDYLWKDGKNNRSEMVQEGHAGAKKAVLRYRILKRVDNLEMLEIRLETGRHHQIRVQMAGRGTPLVGDRKYGKVENYVDNVDNSFPALCAYRIKFRHPSTGKWMEFERKPENPVFQKFM